MNELKTFPECADYWQAQDAEAELYHAVIDLKNEILTFPAIEPSDVYIKAKWMSEKDWEEPENLEVFEYLLQSFHAITTRKSA